MPDNTTTFDWLKDAAVLRVWANDVFDFTREAMKMYPSQPIKELKGVPIKFTDAYGTQREVLLFDTDGRLVYHDLSFYTMEMFENQSREAFKQYNGTFFTWQQTVTLTAYNRAIWTFGMDSFEIAKRWISVKSGHGCFAKGTQVRMANGTIKKVEDVCLLDKIMGDDNTERLVLKLARGQEKMYRVTYQSGDYYDVNESHKLVLVATNNKGKRKLGDITEVTVKEYMTWGKDKKRCNVGYKAIWGTSTDSKLPIDPYLLGLWLGDGASKTGAIYNIDNEIAQYLRSLGLTSERKDKRTNCSEFTVKGLHNKLRCNNLLLNKHIPDTYMQSSFKQRLLLLAGLIDTDGHLSKGSFEITQKRKQLSEQIVELAQSIGCHATLHPKIVNGTTYYRVLISHNLAIIPTQIKRKQSLSKCKKLHFKITVAPLDIEDYFGFVLNGNHRFILADGSVVRNTGKTGTEAVITLHFLICFPGSQIGMTANTEQQVQDIFLKELSKWTRKLPKAISDSIIQTSDHVRIGDSDDWFLRAQVARAEKPEALAGLHGKFVLIIVDEASGVHDKVFEVMKGALTGEFWIVFYASNPTRNDGEFFESHKPGSRYTKLSFSSRHSPIVKEGYIQQMEEDYPAIGGIPSDKVLIRVDGEFAGLAVMDDKGWIPLFANIKINFEQENGTQIIRGGIIALDPAGQGKDRSIASIRDNVYLKEVLNEQTSNPKDLARKIELIRDAYGCSSNDIGIEAFGEGAKVVGEITVKVGEHVTGLLTDKPREGTEQEFNTYKMELAYKFRAWCAAGGIIITNNPSAWLKEMDKVKYRRTTKGQMQLMPKAMYKKEYGFSPDRFDSAIHTFFKDEPTRAVHFTAVELQNQELLEFMRKAQSTGSGNSNRSSM